MSTSKTNKVYAVVEYGDSYEDYWEQIIGICSSLELAKVLKLQSEISHQCEIPYSKWCDMWNEAPDVSSEELIKFLVDTYSEYTKKDILQAVKTYECSRQYDGTKIVEYNFFNNVVELNEYISRTTS